MSNVPDNVKSLDAVSVTTTGQEVSSGGRPFLSAAYVTTGVPTGGVSVTLELQVIPGGPFIQEGPAVTDLASANIIGKTPIPVHQARLVQTGTLTGGATPKLTGHILFMGG